MDQLKQLLAAKPASERKRKSWLDEPRKVQRQITPAALRRILGSKGDVKKRHMRAQQIGQRSGGNEKYGDGENSDVIGAAAYSPRTLVTRRSHLRQITMALKRAGAIPRSMKIKDAALKCYSIKGIDIVTRALMKKKIKTGGAYLRTWKNFMARVETPAAHIVQHLELGVRALKRQLANQPVRQAPELDLIRMCKDTAIDEQWESTATPLVSAGPIHPLWTVLVCSVFMLRSINARSMKLDQFKVDVKARIVELELRCRKNAIDGRPHHIMLSCTCGMAPVCPYCLGKGYMDRRLKFGGDQLFINNRALPISRRALAQTYNELELYSKGAAPKPHSARISGARYWTRMGLSLETTASIGAWSDIKTLKHYIGAAVLTMRMSMELVVLVHRGSKSWSKT